MYALRTRSRHVRSCHCHSWLGAGSLVPHIDKEETRKIEGFVGTFVFSADFVVSPMYLKPNSWRPLCCLSIDVVIPSRWDPVPSTSSQSYPLSCASATRFARPHPELVFSRQAQHEPLYDHLVGLNFSLVSITRPQISDSHSRSRAGLTSSFVQTSAHVVPPLGKCTLPALLRPAAT